MKDQRKPPVSRGNRPEAPPATPGDSGGFSIESTTMRLKSMRVRRAEVERQEAERAAADKHDAVEMSCSDRPAGRVRHDERGVAVWDWAVASGEFQALSATRALKKLEVSELSIAETQREVPALSLQKSGRDQGGGFDPYNQRGSGKRQGEAATRQGITGAKDRDRAAVLDQLLGKKK
ncbi:MAG TPA: hypothetical protein VFP37_05015 [Steroidobacteraceae bacterium]|nr:hypothetical protein [Steroidobacteraceae bacterium]